MLLPSQSAQPRSPAPSFKLRCGRGVKSADHLYVQFGSVQILFNGHCSVPPIFLLIFLCRICFIEERLFQFAALVRIRSGFFVFLVATNAMQWFASRHFFSTSYGFLCAEISKPTEKTKVVPSTTARNRVLFPQWTSIHFRYDQIAIRCILLFVQN